jgi:hypothetical protein
LEVLPIVKFPAVSSFVAATGNKPIVQTDVFPPIPIIGSGVP